MKYVTALAIPALLLVAGCASEQEGTADQSAQAEPAMIAETASNEIVLSGSLGCGHCTFKQTESCAVGIQTADGATYILDGVGEGTELFDARQSGKDVKIVGTLAKEVDGVQHVTMKSYEM